MDVQSDVLGSDTQYRTLVYQNSAKHGFNVYTMHTGTSMAFMGVQGKPNFATASMITPV
jgi:hypothetical protein